MKNTVQQHILRIKPVVKFSGPKQILVIIKLAVQQVVTPKLQQRFTLSLIKLLTSIQNTSM
jgi:hypothetical protein